MTDENDNPFPESPVMPEMFDGSKTLRFCCHPGIACFNACCKSIDISLTPYDILRLKHRLGISSTAFLEEYTLPYEMEKDGIAGVKLRPVENGSACRFMTEAGCSIYEDRPTACRYYPVALLSMRRQDEYVDHNAYALVKEAHCLGHDENREITVDAYRREQGLEEYDEASRGWRQLILKKKSSGPAIGKPSKRSLQLFFTACYDIDRFRDFIVSDGFNALFEIPVEEFSRLIDDDEALLQFAYRFLRQVLFGEESLALHEEAALLRREQAKEKRLRQEREAMERLSRIEEGEYETD